jgi:hypothetical protein
MDTGRVETAQSKLEQIAEVLGIPVTVFLAPPDETVSPAVAAKQEEELLQLFREIHDLGTRERLLNCMRAAAFSICPRR